MPPMTWRRTTRRNQRRGRRRAASIFTSVALAIGFWCGGLGSRIATAEGGIRTCEQGSEKCEDSSEITLALARRSTIRVSVNPNSSRLRSPTPKVCGLKTGHASRPYIVSFLDCNRGSGARLRC